MGESVCFNGVAHGGLTTARLVGSYTLESMRKKTWEEKAAKEKEGKRKEKREKGGGRDFSKLGGDGSQDGYGRSWKSRLI